jgi:flagellin
MGLRITSNGVVESNIAKAQKEASQSLERLTTGVRFTRANPMPAERAVSDSLSHKMREISGYKRNANEAMNVVELADSSLSEISNMTIRLKEIATQSTSPSLSDKERKFLFVEYKSLYDEIDRVARTTAYNGMPLLNGSDENGIKELSFRVGSRQVDSTSEDDKNVIRMNGFSSVIATPAELGLKSVDELLENEDGISLDDVTDLFDSDDQSVSSSFDEAFQAISSFRAGFGAVSSRLTHVVNVLDVTNENIAAANSSLKDVDYATEIANLTRANILVQAGTSLMAQNNIQAQSALTLVKLLEH